MITDARGYPTRYWYDDAGRLTKEIDPLNNATTYGYDPLGRVTVMTDADDGVTTFMYDHLGRLEEVQYPDSSVTYTYDAVGNRTSMTDGTGTTTYAYDELYRPTWVTAPTSSAVGYRYDVLGNRTNLIYPTGQVVTYTYDAAGNLTHIEDWDGGITEYDHDKAGRVLTRTLPNGIATSYGYDDAGRLENLTHSKYWTLARYEYTLDPAGNRTSVEEYVSSLTPPPSVLPVVMHNAGGGEMAMMGGGGEAPELLPVPPVSPLPVPTPEEPKPPQSPLPTPAPVTLDDLVADLNAAYEAGEIDSQRVHKSLLRKLSRAQDHIGNGETARAVEELKAQAELDEQKKNPPESLCRRGRGRARIPHHTGGCGSLDRRSTGCHCPVGRASLRQSKDCESDLPPSGYDAGAAGPLYPGCRDREEEGAALGGAGGGGSTSRISGVHRRDADRRGQLCSSLVRFTSAHAATGWVIAVPLSCPAGGGRPRCQLHLRRPGAAGRGGLFHRRVL